MKRRRSLARRNPSHETLRKVGLVTAIVVAVPAVAFVALAVYFRVHPPQTILT